MFKNYFKNKKVIVTGHTGFKGSWLTLCLLKLGAKVVGISNELSSNPSHFKILKIEKKIKHNNINIVNLRILKKKILNEKPDFIFHLAAQALVKKSFIMPKYTFETNTIGTLNILECLRELKKKCVIILITSDKVYKNLEVSRGYKEIDILGGVDPYSASKVAAELIIKSYIKSFFSNKNNILIAVARAGNVIGGGDWSKDRLIPDCVKAWSKKKSARIRNPNSTRPWQNVLEAVFGYITLAINLSKKKTLHGEAFNFGPRNHQNYSVISVVKLMKKYWDNVSWKSYKKNYKIFQESSLLKLNSQKAKKILKWKSVLTFKENIYLVSDWYKNFYLNSKQAYKLTSDQIEFYQKILKKRAIK